MSIATVTEDTIDGRKMYVLEGTLKTGPEGSTMSGKLCVDQESLLLRRRTITSVSKAKPDEPQTHTSTTDYLNIKLNQKLDPKRFQYSPPEGAVITDNTQPKP
jgi:outer membrane lipoprotein-sorting protein